MRLIILLASIFLLMSGALFPTEPMASNALVSGGGSGATQSTAQGNTQGPPGIVAAGAANEPAVWNQAAAWIWSKQREFHRALTRELRALRGQGGVGWALVWMSFLYGIFHAAGPGHGKAVLTTYLVTHRSRIKRAIAMGTAAAFLQGVTALVVVYGLIGLVGWLPGETRDASLWAARASFVLLALVGMYLLYRAANSLVGVIRTRKQALHEHHHDHSHASHHEHHHHGHGHGEHCGCNHVPSVEQIDAARDGRASLGVILSIGLRPCSGAVLVLILSSVTGLIWHGAMAVLAMSAGTAITVISLAILATSARSWASRLVKHRSPLWAFAGSGISAMGGVVLAGMGLLLLTTSFTMKSSLGF